MKAFSIVSIVIASFCILLNLVWIGDAANYTNDVEGIAGWGFLVSSYLLGWSIVNLVNISKNAKTNL